LAYLPAKRDTTGETYRSLNFCCIVDIGFSILSMDIPGKSWLVLCYIIMIAFEISECTNARVFHFKTSYIRSCFGRNRN